MPSREPRNRRPNHKGGRQVRHVVRVNDAEERLLQSRANERSVTVSRLLYEAATGTLPTMKNQVATSELMGMRFELRKQGENINQMARMAHTERWVFESDLEETRRVIAELDERITRWLKEN